MESRILRFICPKFITLNGRPLDRVCTSLSRSSKNLDHFFNRFPPRAMHVQNSGEANASSRQSLHTLKTVHVCGSSSSDTKHSIWIRISGGSRRIGARVIRSMAICLRKSCSCCLICDNLSRLSSRDDCASELEWGGCGGGGMNVLRDGCSSQLICSSMLWISSSSRNCSVSSGAWICIVDCKSKQIDRSVLLQGHGGL